MLAQPRSPLHKRAIDPPKQRDTPDDARPGSKAIHKHWPGRGRAGHGRERPVARGQDEVEERHVLERRDEGRDRAPWKAAVEPGRGRARAERCVA